MKAKLSCDLLGKRGSESAAAKCAAATQHESHKFSIDEGKPYAEVRSSCSHGHRAKKLKPNVDMDGNASYFTFEGSTHSAEPAGSNR